jgi:hypothetical protein
VLRWHDGGNMVYSQRCYLVLKEATQDRPDATPHGLRGMQYLWDADTIVLLKRSAVLLGALHLP